MRLRPCYFGEYPLMFAACHNQFNIVRLLMQYSNQRQHHDKKSMQHWLDANGNNVLHMMVISGLKHMYRFMLLECHCNDQHHNNRGFTPLSLAAYLGKSDMFHFILKLKCIPLWSYGKTCCALYPLQEIDTVSCRKEEKQMSVISHVVTRNTVIHSEMIDGLIYAILQAKWKLYAKWRFFRQLAVFTVYIVLLTASLYLRPSKDSNQLMVNKTIVGACTGIASNISRNCSSLVMNQIGDPCYLRDCWDDANCIWRYCSEIGALIVALIFLGVFGYHMKTQGWKKLQSPTEMLVLLSCFLIILAIPGRAACHSDYEDILLTLAVVLAWPYYMFFHRGFKLVGPFVVMIFKMCKADLVRFILIYAIFMMGFSQALYVLFVGTSTELFNHPAGAMLGLFHMTLGEFQDHYDEMSQSSYQFLAKALFVVMMVLMFTLLVNMLIAMMGNTYQTVADTRKEWTRQWAQIVLIMEKTVGWRDLCKYQKQYMYEGGSGGWTGYFAYTSYDNNVEDDQQVVKPSSIDLYEALNIPSKNVFSA
ncbi:transient receptor potential cation channel subfamily V member 6-like isoform X2 [Corticium candelabrum]|uniref:transient receptor potential cation channel subfamily V member 6-like isoform X2 n=1 Tax=Corticium candelabrum TaxID=121492 RepID=UPI002E262FA2|nr:transient receptor potential cation channel subfamily V member 6-like isoform X2 [Corticium candelabrum]